MTSTFPQANSPFDKAQSKSRQPMVAHVRYNIMALDGICKPIGKSFTMFQILFQEFPLLRYTPSILEKNVVLDKVWVKHWEYKS